VPHCELAHCEKKCGSLADALGLHLSARKEHHASRYEHHKSNEWSPSSHPSRTLPTAFAAPVELGMMLALTARPPRQSFLLGPSTVFCVAVVACTVVIKPSLMPNFWCTTFTSKRTRSGAVGRDGLQLAWECQDELNV
jgi:hypothetical protein